MDNWDSATIYKDGDVVNFCGTNCIVKRTITGKLGMFNLEYETLKSESMINKVKIFKSLCLPEPK